MGFPCCFHRHITAVLAQSNGTIVTRLSFLRLQRGNAVLDALRPILTVQRGADLRRRASPTACQREALAR
ncbi:hypothetical protein ALO64_100875 [Pseudomonas meliae]|uniref:DUF1534 domain-containing protein n=1 Tax=Pseudomonas meliae TaxID=86176 RepID=A0A0P9U9X9_9PSED|nr:hypothetical protein ALO64_100875 [Pseudomonas meliae]